MQLGGIEQGKNYEPLNDPIVKCFEVLGEAVLLADGDVNQTELSCLSNFTAIAQSKAAEIGRTIQSRTDAGTGDAPQYAPVANQNRQLDLNPAPLCPATAVTFLRWLGNRTIRPISNASSVAGRRTALAINASPYLRPNPTILMIRKPSV